MWFTLLKQEVVKDSYGKKLWESSQSNEKRVT